jgi:pilus assembly protein Flp/PilA
MKLFEILKNEDGQGMVEYGLILGLIAIAAVVALLALGPKISEMFETVTSKLPATPAT